MPDVLNGPDLRNMRIRTVLQNQAFIDNCRPCAFFKPLDPQFDVTGRNPHFATREIGARTQIVWKYILFDTTESEELLDRAQNLARELGPVRA